MTAMWALAHALGIAENLVNILGFSHNDSLIYKNNNNNNNNGYNQYQRKYYILEVQIQQISKRLALSCSAITFPLWTQYYKQKAL